MEAVFLENDAVALKTLSPKDHLEHYARWLNDQDTTTFMWSGNLPQNTDDLKDYIKAFNKKKDGMLLGIFLKETSAHIGNVALYGIDWKNRYAEIGFLIGEKEARGKGYASQALKLVIGHAFNRLNLRRLFALIVEGNDVSRHLFEKFGFQLEGTYREHFYLNDRYHDGLYYGLLKSEYRNSDHGE